MFGNRSIFLRHQVNLFVLLFVERAGSTYMTTLLNDHPDILALGEKLGIMKNKGQEAGQQMAWARKFLQRPLLGRNKARGFKTKLVDVLNPKAFAALLQERRCRIIRLQRENAIKAVVSTLNAKRLWEASGYWNLLQESNRLPPFEVDLEEFDTLLDEREVMDRELESFTTALNLPTLSLVYEDLLRDESAFVNNFYEFLEVQPKPAQGITLKNTKDDLREVIVNFDQLRTRYAGTRYEPMFEEVIA